MVLAMVQQTERMLAVMLARKSAVMMVLLSVRAKVLLSEQLLARTTAAMSAKK